MTKKLDLIHLANFNSTNIGNGALISGLESTIAEDFVSGVQWLREPWDNYTFGLVDFDEAFVKKVNASNGLIVGGAVTFNGRDYNNRTGTRFELPFECWSKLEKPVVFYGLSYRHWKGQTYHHLDKLKKFIELSLANEKIIFSVRNDGTKEWIKDIIGIDSPEILEIPDSAIFVQHEAQKYYYPEIVQDKINIILSFNDEDAINRFSQKENTQLPFEEVRKRIISSYAYVVKEIATKYKNVNFILCPHYFDDYKMLSDLIESLPPRLAHQQLVSTGLNSVKDTSYFYGRYSRATLVISMRVHSMSPSIGLGVPMIAFTTQDRMEKFMHRIGLSDHMVDAFADNSAELLLSRVLNTLEDQTLSKDKFKKVRSNLRKDACDFHAKLEKFILENN